MRMFVRAVTILVAVISDVFTLPVPEIFIKEMWKLAFRWFIQPLEAYKFSTFSSPAKCKAFSLSAYLDTSVL